MAGPMTKRPAETEEWPKDGSMATTFEVLYLGQLASIDVNETDSTNERAYVILGTHGSAGQPLFDHIQTFSRVDSSTGSNPDAYDFQDANDRFSINGGAPQSFDGYAWYDAVLTYVDGTTATVNIPVFQDSNGKTYLGTPLTTDADSFSLLQAKPIQSVNLTAVTDTVTIMNAERTVPHFVHHIDGTGGNDSLSVGYTDAQGDKIGSGNDFIEGYGGNDFISAGAGNDTLLGGDGNDTLRGGQGADSLDGGAGRNLLDYSDNTSGFTANLLTNVVFGGDANGDTIANMTDVLGSNQGDTIILSNTSGIAWGENGNDSLRGGTGNDTLFGGVGNDTLEGMSGNDSLDGGNGSDFLAGGKGNDLVTGGGGNDTFSYAPGDGADTITDFNVGNTGALNDGTQTNNDFINLSAYYDDIFELRADFADDGILNQSNATDPGGDAVDYSDNTRFAPGDSLTFQGANQSSFSTDNTGTVCFATGTMILTPSGEVAIERLRPGDLVVTKDNGPEPLVWSGMRRLDARELDRLPHLRPIEIKAGAFGNHSALLVSPQHGLLLRHDRDEVMIRAKHLAEMRGGAVRVRNGCRAVTYCHLMFERHQVIFANGMASESFFPGPEAIKALERRPYQEVMTLFPALRVAAEREAILRIYGDTARRFLQRADMPCDIRALRPVQRHPIPRTHRVLPRGKKTSPQVTRS